MCLRDFIERHYTANLPTGNRSERLKGSQGDLDVQEKRAILDVIEIIRELVRSFKRIKAVTRRLVLMNLRPAREARLNEMANIVVGDFVGIVFNRFRKFRPGPDKRKISSQNVPQLRKFIEPSFPKEITDFGHFIGHAFIAPIDIVVEKHGPKFQDTNDVVIASNTILVGKNWSSVFKLHG